ncbi:TPA: fimbrial protein [Salmonella enterica subsp. houtenae]|nr:fimbrial protein [Salmonella enterica subsp. houtenae]
MKKYWLLFFIVISGYFPLTSVYAANCSFPDLGGEYSVFIPQMAIPADTPDGTLLYSSPKQNIKVVCDGTPTKNLIVATVTSDFSEFLKIRNGIKVTLYINDVPFSYASTVTLGQMNTTPFQSTMSVRVEVKVDRSMGTIPPQGTYLSGGFQSVFVMPIADYSAGRGVISLYTPNIVFIPCSMDLSLVPDTINFGQMQNRDLESGKKYSKVFTTHIVKSKGCSSLLNPKFGINILFSPVGQSINPNGSLNLNNGLGLSISDENGIKVPFNTEWQIENVDKNSILSNNFTATVQKVAGQTIKNGDFSGDVVVEINYF